MSRSDSTATTRATEQPAPDEIESGSEHQPAAELEPKPDVSDQRAEELLPKLLEHFHNSKEELARALGVHRSSVDRWLSGKSRPNTSTLLRMRGIAQERGIA